MPKLVLYLDDCEPDLALFRDTLEGSGVTVEATRHQGDFMERLRTQDFDLVLVDQMMYGQLDAGTALIECLVDEFGENLPPTYLMSGLPANFVEDLVSRCGASGFLSKDDPSGWVEEVQKLLGV